MTISAEKQIETILKAKGQFVSVSFRSDVATSAQFKDVVLHKETKAVCRAGINFANLTSVKEGIAKEERSEVGELPWGNWIKFPYIIGHKDNEYLRLYPSNGIPNVTYFVNGKVADKLSFASFLTPSNKKRLLDRDKDPVECFTVKSQNILDIKED